MKTRKRLFAAILTLLLALTLLPVGAYAESEPLEASVYRTVTFDANGHGTVPTPSIQVPDGKTIWDVIESYDVVSMADDGDWRFYDYSLKSDTRNGKDYFDFDTQITQDIRLYAIWHQDVKIMNLSLPGGVVDAAYSAQIKLNKEALLPALYTISTGTLPQGLTLDNSTGTISGTPTISGEFTFTVRVDPYAGSAVVQAFTVTIAEADEEWHKITMDMNGGKIMDIEMVTWVDKVSMAFPNGYEQEIPTLDLMNEKLADGSWIKAPENCEYIGAMVTDINGTKTYKPGDIYTVVSDATITVLWKNNEHTITYVYDASGGTPEDFDWDTYKAAWTGVDHSALAGGRANLPQLAASASMYSGKLKGYWTFAWTAVTDGSESVDTTNAVMDPMPADNVTVTGKWTFHPNAGAPPVISTDSLPEATEGMPYRIDLSASGDMPEWTLVNGSLPDGLQLGFGDSGHVIFGNLTAAPGLYTFTVRAENLAGWDEKALSIDVKAESLPVLYTITLDMSGGTIRDLMTDKVLGVLTIEFPAGYGQSLPSNDWMVEALADGSWVTAPAGCEYIGAQITDASGTRTYQPDEWYEVTSDVTIKVLWRSTVTPPEPVTYTVIGGDSSWTKDSPAAITVTVKRSPDDSACFSHFTGVNIDGTALINGTDYTAVSGSTVITIPSSVLQKLTEGIHTVTVIFDDGSATLNLTVAGSGTPGSGNPESGTPGSNTSAAGSAGSTSPKTGDESSLMLWSSLLLLSAAAMLILLFRRKAVK